MDIFPAKGVTVEKVFEENSPKFPGSRPGGETQISGNKAMVLNWAPMAGVSGRAYFLVKNDQLYRVVVTWAREKQDVYLPVFEKMVQSLQLK